jgi:hypothetical protein
LFGSFFVSSVESICEPGDEFGNRTEEAMFCDGCGANVQPGQAFCSKCGKQIVGPITVMQPIQGRVQRHTHLLSVLWLALSAFNALGGLIVVIVGTMLFPHLRQMHDAPPDMPFGFLTVLVTTIGIFVLAKAACGFIAARGLMEHEPWARTAVLVLAFISLFNIPLGTALGVYTLWVLLPGESQQEYDALAARAA